MPRIDYSPELIERCTIENLIARSRIGELGRMAAGYANPVPRSFPRKNGDPYSAGMFARRAAHDARLLFPDLFLWDGERYGQQLNLGVRDAA